MSSVNKVILIGNTGSDPEIRNVSGNRTVASFSFATSESYKDRTTGERKSETTWHNITAWGALAEIIGKYVKKGSKLYLEGKIKTRSYEKDGSTRYATEIIAENMSLLGEKPQAAQRQTVATSRDELPWT